MNADQIAQKFSYIFAEQNEKISKNEMLILNAFSYVCSQTDELYNSISEIKKSIEILSVKLDESINNLNKQNEDFGETADESIQVKVNSNKQIKRKRSIFYRLTKCFKYRKLLKQKHELEKQIDIINEYRRKEREQNRLAEEKRKIEQKRLEEEKRKKNLAERNDQINNILKKSKNIKKGSH